MTQIDRSDLIRDMACAMNDVADCDTSREQFAEAAVEVLQRRNLLVLPEDRLDLMDEITTAMWDKETPGWNTPTWHPYAEAILSVLDARGVWAAGVP